jgi:hypothetical protein
MLSLLILICLLPPLLIIVTSLCDKGNRFDGNYRNDIPSSVGFIISIILILFFILKFFYTI